MSGVFREMEISWGGVNYSFVPSNKLLRRIDAGLSPRTIVGVFTSAKDGEFPVFDIAYIASEFLRAGGANIDEDEMYAEFTRDMQENGGAGVRALVEVMGVAINPVSIEKKPVAPLKPKSAAVKKAAK